MRRALSWRKIRHLYTNERNRSMATKATIDGVTDLAKQIAAKELERGESESSAELLQALGSVAKMLSAKAGNDPDIKALVTQVQELVNKKTSN